MDFLENLVLKVQAACRTVYTETAGCCRDASIVLVKELLTLNIVEAALICHGKCAGRDHFWVRVDYAGNKWILDPTVDQFEKGWPVVRPELGASPNYVEYGYICIDPKALRRLSAAVGEA